MSGAGTFRLCDRRCPSKIGFTAAYLGTVYASSKISASVCKFKNDGSPAPLDASTYCARLDKYYQSIFPTKCGRLLLNWNGLLTIVELNTKQRITAPARSNQVWAACVDHRSAASDATAKGCYASCLEFVGLATGLPKIAHDSVTEPNGNLLYR